MSASPHCGHAIRLPQDWQCDGTDPSDWGSTITLQDGQSKFDGITRSPHARQRDPEPKRAQVLSPAVTTTSTSGTQAVRSNLSARPPRTSSFSSFTQLIADLRCPVRVRRFIQQVPQFSGGTGWSVAMAWNGAGDVTSRVPGAAVPLAALLEAMTLISQGELSSGAPSPVSLRSWDIT
jgi:hypothetical protein